MAISLTSALAACTIEKGQDPAAQEAQKVEEAKQHPPTISVADGATDVEPGVPVEVSSDAGLSTVTMTNEEGKEVQAEMAPDSKTWKSTEPLGYGRTYTVEASTAEGKTATSKFTTVMPAMQTTLSVNPQENSTVGIAQAINFYFDVAPADRKAVEDAIIIETSNNTEGAFFWTNGTILKWRPKEFWQPGTQVTVRADIYGKDLGGGVYGAADTGTKFTIGEDIRAVVDNATKMLTVYNNGAEVKSIPVSLGRDGGMWDTPNGIYVVGDKHPSMVMDSRTYGYSLEAGGYVTPVSYATQLSWSGIYVHAAPWAYWALGNTNQSHGCVNATYEDAQWFQEYLPQGAPVEVKGTGGPTLDGTDGLGYWNISWEDWKKGSPTLQ
ncbi:Ig-like domain-containing protein [Corynebacterium aquatimens]